MTLPEAPGGLMTITAAARCLGWSRTGVRNRAERDGALIDGRTLPRYYRKQLRWFVTEAWVDAVGEEELLTGLARMPRGGAG